MYKKYFSFKQKPFELTPNPDFLYLSSTHKKAVTYLDYGIKERIGFILLTGEIGSGKTTIVRNIIKNINGASRLSRINNTKVSSEQLLSMINEDFGLDVDGKSKTRLLSDLNEFLIEQYSRNVQPILLIDEAQNLSSDVLEEIRLLSNLETDRAKMLQIILIGQPELKTTLLMPELMQLRQRININYHITPLTVKETEEYVKHRLTIAGNAAAFKFEEGMLEVLYKFSRGIPRLINIICDFSLLTAFIEKRKEVTVDIVREIVQDLESRNYWNDPVRFAGNEKDKKGGDTRLIKTVGDIAMRLIRVEESMTNNFPELSSLADRIAHLEKSLLEMKGVQENKQMDELTERISMLEHAAEGRSVDKEDTGAASGSEGSVKEELDRIGQQVESLSGLVNYLNNKFKNSKS